jgi:predicted KAP-like P-loop ATPase
MAAAKPILGYISDHETKVDLLRNEAIASTIVKLINEHSDRPVTIGVHGDWGAGKSSILEMIEFGFAGREEILCLKFNGWQFQGFEDAKIALIEGVVTELIEKRGLLTKAADETKRVLKHINWLKAAKRLGGLAFNAFTGLPSPEQIGDLLSIVKAKLQDPATFVTKENAAAVAKELQGLWREAPETKNVPEEIREFRKAFTALLKKADVDRLVVLVDDLDRCLPETAVETLEAIRLFVALPNTAFVVGADEAMIKYSVQRHFPDLPQTEPWSDYPRAYLEKLIQVPFRIPTMGETETRIYVSLLFVGSLVGEDTSQFTNLLAHAREVMSKPWERKGIEEADVQSALGTHFTSQVRDALILANRITPVLARGTKGNPRQVKRFLNAMNLRLRVSDARGFGSAIDPQVLAKVMLAERFLPSSVFEHIASAAATSTDGVCSELKHLEEHVTSDSAGEKKSSAVGSLNAIVEDWLTRPDVVRWAEIEPKIGSIDLQPYLFVINDVKNYIGAEAPLSPKLKALFDRLISGDLAAKGAAAEIKNLDAAEIEPLARMLRVQVLASPSFAQRPNALLGLGELIMPHASFSQRYLELLEELPAAQLGIWAATGHDKYVPKELKPRFDSLIARWKAEGSTQLKSTLETRTSIKPGRN